MASIVSFIHNALVRYNLVIKDQTAEPIVVLEAAKQAILYIISTMDAWKHDKFGDIKRIWSMHPDLVIPESEMYIAFLHFVDHQKQTSTGPTPHELGWVNRLIKDPTYLHEIEAVIFCGMLESDRYDNMRHISVWRYLTTQTEMNQLAATVLKDGRLDAKRKYEIAMEFALPCSKFAKLYFKTLLEGNHFAHASCVQGLLPWDKKSIAQAVMMDKLAGGDVFNAWNIAHNFLSEQTKMVSELNELLRRLDL